MRPQIDSLNSAGGLGDSSSLAPWPVAIFAHNEAGSIVACLDALASAAQSHPLRIFVLANGCRDATARIVRNYDAGRTGCDIRIVEIALGDKANAWNIYVHELAPSSPIHFFMDGDVRADRGSLACMAETLGAHPASNAVAALPSNGRDWAGICDRMTRFGRLAGGLYALSGRFVEQLRRENIRLPLGLIGDDWLVACLAKDDLTPRALMTPSGKIVFHHDATYSIRPLDPFRPRDWRRYPRRLVRYWMREHQFMMLLRLWGEGGVPKLPANVDQLYALSPAPAYQWRGKRLTLFDAIAVWKIRRTARAGGKSLRRPPDS